MTFFFVGDVTVPPISAGDLLLVAPTGGYPKSSTRFLEVARDAGARVAAYTANRDGPIGDLSDLLIVVLARTMTDRGNEVQSVQPMSTTVEQVGMILFGVVLHLLFGTESSNYKSVLETILRSIEKSLNVFKDEKYINIFKYAENKKHFCFVAKGVDLILLSCFAMRISHMNKEVYVVDEVRWPPPNVPDVVVSLCCTSCDDIVSSNLNTIGSACSDLIVLTCENESPRLSIPGVYYVQLPPYSDIPNPDYIRDAYMYPAVVIVVLDYVVLRMMQEWKFTETDLVSRHTNLE